MEASGTGLLGVCTVAEWAVGLAPFSPRTVGVSTSTFEIAIDLEARLMWSRGSHGASWNGNPSADPVTGVGGTDISSLTGDLYFIANSPNNGFGPLTVNFGAAGFANDPPYGYAGWTA